MKPPNLVVELRVLRLKLRERVLDIFELADLLFSIGEFLVSSLEYG